MPFGDTSDHSGLPAKSGAEPELDSKSWWSLGAAQEVRLGGAAGGVPLGSGTDGEGSRTRVPGAAPHEDRDESGYTWISSRCFQLYEEGRRDGANQDCKCRSRREGKPRFTNRDFDKHVELCACCGLEAIPSGSRWSVFYCRECQLMIMGMSHRAGGLVLPIGRHTLMHTWVLNWRRGA